MRVTRPRRHHDSTGRISGSVTSDVFARSATTNDKSDQP